MKNLIYTCRRQFNFSAWFIGLSIMVSLLACSDHIVPGPERLRLKKVEGGVTATYTYDSQNRLATLINSDFGLVVFTYDEDQKKFVELKQYPKPADQTTGTSFRFPYSFGRSSFSVQSRSIKNSEVDYSYYGVIESASYTYDNLDPKHLSIYRWPGVTTGGSGLREFDYWYTDENITTENFHYPNNYPDKTSFEYDNKVNPFFGSPDPTSSDIQRFSRNNVTKITYSPYPYEQYPDKVTVYDYEYNQQGLPTKRTIKQGDSGAVITYTYESY